MAIKFVEQEEKSGCAIACIAMVLGKTYRQVRKDWNNDFEADGTDLEKTMNYLGENGFQLVHKYVRNYSHKDFARKEMLKPYAPVHLVRIIPLFDADRGHVIVMDARGKLICPQGISDKVCRESYAITDVVGVFK